MKHTNQKEYEFAQLMDKYVYQADVAHPNKNAIMSLIEDAYKLGLNQGWALEQEIRNQLKEPL
jgi:hypothetical protein